MSTELVNVALSADSITLTSGAPSGQALIGNGTVFVATAFGVPVVGGGAGYAVVGGLVIQWGVTGSINNDTPTGVSFPYTFPNACLSVVSTDAFLGGRSANWSSYSFTTTGFTIRPDGNTGGANWIAVGY